MKTECQLKKEAVDDAQLVLFFWESSEDDSE